MKGTTLIDSIHASGRHARIINAQKEFVKSMDDDKKTGRYT